MWLRAYSEKVTVMDIGFEMGCCVTYASFLLTCWVIGAAYIGSG